MSTAQKSRNPFTLTMVAPIIWFMRIGVFGSLFGKLTSVYEIGPKIWWPSKLQNN